jgi:hypothetical protein
VQRELPKILVQGQKHSGFGFSLLDQASIRQAGALGADPKDIVTLFS